MCFEQVKFDAQIQSNNADMQASIGILGHYIDDTRSKFKFLIL